MLKVYKGDTINLQFNMAEDITGWKIRADFYDNARSIKLATTNSGGSDDQIYINDAVNGKFQVRVEANQTSDFCDFGNVEVEVETPDGQVFTYYKSEVNYLAEKITWTEPT